MDDLVEVHRGQPLPQSLRVRRRPSRLTKPEDAAKFACRCNFGGLVDAQAILERRHGLPSYGIGAQVQQAGPQQEGRLHLELRDCGHGCLDRRFRALTRAEISPQSIERLQLRGREMDVEHVDVAIVHTRDRTARRTVEPALMPVPERRVQPLTDVRCESSVVAVPSDNPMVVRVNL